MITKTRVFLTAVVLVVAYLILMTGVIGTIEFVILGALVLGALAAVWLLPRRT